MRCMKMEIQRLWLVVFSCLLFAVPAIAVDKLDVDFGDNGLVTGFWNW